MALNSLEHYRDAVQWRWLLPEEVHDVLTNHYSLGCCSIARLFACLLALLTVGVSSQVHDLAPTARLPAVGSRLLVRSAVVQAISTRRSQLGDA